MKARYGEITKQILIAVGVAGVVVVVAAAPGVLLAAKLLPKDFEQNFEKPKKKSIARSMRNLRKNKFIAIKEKNGKLEVKLTKKGKKVFNQIQLEKIQILKPLRWDGRWRVLVFDIPENSHRGARAILRSKIKEWGFYPLQKSVWICPWPCESEIQLISELYEVGPYVDIIVAEKIVDDERLRKHFNLPSK